MARGQVRKARGDGLGWQGNKAVKISDLGIDDWIWKLQSKQWL
jgi:hypothetical protein